MNNLAKEKLPRECDLLFWIFTMFVGAIIASTGTFSKLGMGTWGGPQVRFPGWILFGVSLFGVFSAMVRLLFLSKTHHIPILAFGVAVVIGAIASFISGMSSNLYIRILGLCWIAALLSSGHVLYKMVLKTLLANKHLGEG